MFRKTKKNKKSGIRKRTSDEDEREGDVDTSTLLEEARQQSKKQKSSTSSAGFQENSSTTKTIDNSKNVMHSYQVSDNPRTTAKDLATQTAQHHPTQTAANANEGIAEKGADGIFRDKTRNKFHAGPIKAATFVRTTARFDYQPDVCKDYKDTGFCGFGDTCIYLHDRGDTMTGWQLEQQWEEQKKKEQQKKELDAFADGSSTKRKEQGDTIQSVEDGLPFACHICRDYFKRPVVTSCGHYFCEQCIMNHVQNEEKASCPICNKDTHGVFNLPTKLISKKRRLLGSKATWQEFADGAKGK